MRYRVDLVLKEGQTIDIFRQTLRNDSKEDLAVTLANITRKELERGINFLLRNNRSFSNNVLKSGRNGIVDFKVFDNPKGIGGRRNITFTSSINKDNYTCKYVDTDEIDEYSPCYFSPNHDISMYLNYGGNPDIMFGFKKRPVEAEEEQVSKQDIIDSAREVTGDESLYQEEEQKIAEVAEIEIPDYIKKDGKFYCPFEDCEKHKDGYATERAMKNHMIKIHGANY